MVVPVHLDEDSIEIGDRRHRLQLRGVPVDQIFGACEEGFERDAAFIAFAASADADGVGGGLLVAEDEDEGEFLQAKVADLGVHLLVAHVEFHAQTGGFELRLDLFRVGEVLLAADGDEADLHGCEIKAQPLQIAPLP